MYAQPIELKLKKSYVKETYGFSISTTENLVHFVRGIHENGIASKNGIEEGDCILAVNKATIHMRLNNQEATLLIKQNPKKVHLLILKKADYESRSLEALHAAIEALGAKLSKLEEESNKSMNVEQSLVANNKKLKQENEVLRQQVNDLQASQKEYDFLKLEISQIIEDNELVETENHQITQFQLLTDLQIEEALSSTKDQDIDKSELLQQNNKLKVLHNIRKEQIAKLRSVLNSNKISPDTALQNLKNKYETEKKIQDEILEKLRRELKQSKFDAETFSSQRTSYTARCEELQAQVESLEHSLKTAEEEKENLNSLLRATIQQNEELTERLKVLEQGNERRPSRITMPPQKV